MIRLIVLVEGQTEEVFVKDVLKPHLDGVAVYTSVTIVGKVVGQARGHRGRGGGHFRAWRKDIARLLKGDPSGDLRVTTLFDLYGLPADFPGLAEHGADADTSRRCDALEAALGAHFEDPRLIPYIQRHEFEALVFASIDALGEALDAPDDLAGLSELAAVAASTAPEDINDGEHSAPSKRLLRHVPGYSKTLHGPLATGAVGLARLRERCPRFDDWVARLEGLASSRR